MFNLIKKLVDAAKKGQQALNDKQKEQAAKGFHSVSVGAGLTVGLNFITDDRVNTALDNWMILAAFVCAIIFQVLAVKVLKNKEVTKCQHCIFQGSFSHCYQLSEHFYFMLGRLMIKMIKITIINKF